jgi:aconitate hydratase
MNAGMITLVDKAVVFDGDVLLDARQAADRNINLAETRRNTMAHNILTAHNKSADENAPCLRFDALASHDITFVGIIQTARASGLTKFPVPYVLTNCHNSLCAVGGTINEDDHLFGLTAAQKYGGIFVPPNLAIIHQFVREVMTRCGGMILGSDSHTRYGALGVMGIGEGGPELVKQLLEETYDVPAPKVVAVWLEGAPAPGVGPQDVALAIIKAVFRNGFVKNKIMEFIGPGLKNLSVEYRCGIDVMTTETTCLSSIWTTDEKVRDYLSLHGRPEDFARIAPLYPACYDALIKVDLDKIEPMIALPFHPSNVWTIAEINRNTLEILKYIEEETTRQFGKIKLDLKSKIRDGRLCADQAVIAGCAGGTFENISLAAAILDGKCTGNQAFNLAVYPASAPQALELVRSNAAAKLMASGVIIKNAFCGPCFGAGDTPANGALSIRHSTRNFPNREGSKPSGGQLAAVALMDARSIAATAANGGRLTSATELDWNTPRFSEITYHFDPLIYKHRVYNGIDAPKTDTEIIFGPNIADWPTMTSLPQNLILQLACVITDPVTTTDELIPSGETSSLRSNPLKLAEFTLSRKDPGYVGRAQKIQCMEKMRTENPDNPILREYVGAICNHPDIQEDIQINILADIGLGSAVFAIKPGDGSAREQAASCQKVLGGWANIAVEYATKRYRSNLINWGMLPFVVSPEIAEDFCVGDYLVIAGVRKAVEQAQVDIHAWLVHEKDINSHMRHPKALTLTLAELTEDERQIILDGCLINFYNRRQGKT